MTRWKKFRYQLEELGCRILVWGIPRLSRANCLRLSRGLGYLASRLDRRGRQVAQANLACAFGSQFSPAQRDRIIRASYQNFVRTMLDLFWAQRLTAEEARRWMPIHGLDSLQQRLKRESCSAIMMCIHQGNWEWSSLAYGFLGHPLTVVAENFKNERLSAIFSGMRGCSGSKVIAQEYSILRLLRVAKGGGTTGMLIDLSLPPDQASSIIEGFGLKMCVPVLHAHLALRTNCLLVPVETLPQPDGSCQILLHPPVDFPTTSSPDQITQLCWNTMEALIRKHPENYLWAYKHFRYKPKDASRDYPFYARTSAKFERALRK